MTIEGLLDQHGDSILRLCLLYLGDRQLAEDAFQETFLKAWKHQDSFRGDSSEKTWLTHIAMNVCRSMLRSGWFRLRKQSQDIDTLLSLTAPEEGRHLDLTRELCALPGKYREVILLYYYENMNTREIAQLLHLPANTVSTRLRTARSMLHAALEGGDAHDA